MDAIRLSERLPLTAFAFRGYNVTNLGRTAEFLEDERYRDVFEDYLKRAASICGDLRGRRVDLIDLVQKGEETTLETYSEAVSLIVAAECAQLKVLETVHHVKLESAKVCFGYSLGEIAALVNCGVVEMEDALRIPLSLAEDCVELASDVSLAILISRGIPIPSDEVKRLCIEINQQGEGVVGISAYLSPNSFLMMGQADTLNRFKKEMKTAIATPLHLRRHEGHWPPLHTPIMWDRSIPNRSAVLMHTMKGGFQPPEPPVLSMVTGKDSYNEFNAREILHRWADHPQRLWDVVYGVLAMGVELIVHVGPEPNIIPATFKRLRDNVEAQTRGHIGMRALSSVVKRPWLSSILPDRTALLRTPFVDHLILEDWLLDN